MPQGNSVDDALDRLHEMADELGLEDDERESFIESGMARKGYQQRSTWAEPDEDQGGGQRGDFFATKRGNQREVRRVPGQGNRGGQQRGGGLTRYSA